MANAGAFVALGVTGVLLLPAPFSNLREVLLGGRFEIVRDVHLWSAVPFFVTLAAVYAVRGWKILRLKRVTPLLAWKKLNALLALTLSLLLAGTGLLLWLKPEAAAGWMPVGRQVHYWSTWAVIPWVLLHAGVEIVRWTIRRRKRTVASSVLSAVAASQALPVCTEEVKTP